MNNNYYYEESTSGIFIVYHSDEVKTFIAKTDTAEKADFITKACNYFEQHLMAVKNELS